MITQAPLAGMFEPKPIDINPNGVNNFINNMSALHDPSGTLQRMQADQILKHVADVKLDGVTGQYKQHALNAIKDYTDFSKSLYNDRTGVDRLTLSADQQLQEDNKFRDLLMNVNSLNEASKDYKQTMDRAHEDFKNNTISGVDYKNFTADLDAKNATAKSVDQVPLASAVYNKYLMNKPYSFDDVNKTVQAAVGHASIDENVVPEGNTFYNVKTRDVAPITETLWGNDPKLAKYWTDNNGGDSVKGKAAFQTYMNQFNVNSKKYGGSVPQGRESFSDKKAFWDYSHPTTHVDLDETDNPSLGPNGKTTFLNSQPATWDGQIDYTNEKGEKVRTAAVGDPSKGDGIYQIDNDGKKMTAIINVKYTKPVLRNAADEGDPPKWVPDTNSSGKPITETVNGQVREDVNPNMLSRLKKNGYNTAKLEKSYAAFKSGTAPSSSTPTKLSGKIDPSTLKPGSIYEVGGKKYKWNGTKLVTP